jgi:hypothetical protein
MNLRRPRPAPLADLGEIVESESGPCPGLLWGALARFTQSPDSPLASQPKLQFHVLCHWQNRNSNVRNVRWPYPYRFQVFAMITI